MWPGTPIIRKKGFSDLVLTEILALIGELMQSETLQGPGHQLTHVVEAAKMCLKLV